MCTFIQAVHSLFYSVAVTITVTEVARRSQEHGTRRHGTSLKHLIKHGDDGHRYTHSQTL